MLKEFRDFIIKGNALDLAIGVIIGAAFSAVVGSLVDDIVMPPLGFLMGGIDFSNYFVDLTALRAQVVDGQAAPALDGLKAAKDAGHAVIAYGNFLNTIIKLLLIGFAIFMVIKQINRFKRDTPVPPAAVPEDVKLLTEIRDLMARPR